MNHTFNKKRQVTSAKARQGAGAYDLDVTYSYDSMARPSAMMGSASVSGVAYNPAD